MVVSDAIYRQPLICLFDRVIYERSMLVRFSNLIFEAASNFQSHTSATTSDIDQNRTLNRDATLANKLYSKPFAPVDHCKPSLAYRLVCAYTGSCDDSIPEMGALAVGCLRAPIRSSSSLIKKMSGNPLLPVFWAHRHLPSFFLFFKC